MFITQKEKLAIVLQLNSTYQAANEAERQVLNGLVDALHIGGALDALFLGVSTSQLLGALTDSEAVLTDAQKKLIGRVLDKAPAVVAYYAKHLDDKIK